MTDKQATDIIRDIYLAINDYLYYDGIDKDPNFKFLYEEIHEYL